MTNNSNDVIAPTAQAATPAIIGCLHDPANVQQTSANVFKIHVNCWTFAGSLLDRVNTPITFPFIPCNEVALPTPSSFLVFKSLHLTEIYALSRAPSSFNTCFAWSAFPR